MAGDLFVIARIAGGPGYHLIAGPVTLADATDAVTKALTERVGVRVVVTRAIRSFTSSATVQEDPAPVIDP